MNGLAINPAYAGSRDVLSLSLMSRWQWVGFEGAPFTTTFSGNMPFKNKALAMGLLLMDQKYGVTDNLSCFGNYAYRIRTYNGFLSFGLKAGFGMLRENQSQFTTQTPEALFNTGNKGYFLPNFGFGIYYYNTKYFAGLSVPTFLSYREKSQGNGFVAYNNVKNYNYLLSAGMLINVSDNIIIKPSTLIKYMSNWPVQYDLNCNVYLMKDGKLSVGAAYRNNDAIVGMFEFQLNTQWRLGYSYDYSIGGLSRYNSGSHEIMLRYEFRYILKALNPKYF
jgi:type IX secretion system PorP/SprF family membrane protein